MIEGKKTIGGKPPRLSNAVPITSKDGVSMPAPDPPLLPSNKPPPGVQQPQYTGLFERSIYVVFLLMF
ncbi:hypothetical protein Bca4012_068901 [Brassica carinata]